MEKLRRIFAWLGIIILVGLYITTFLTGIFAKNLSHDWFAASMVATVVIPILLYAYNMIYRIIKQNAEESKMHEEAFLKQMKEEAARMEEEKKQKEKMPQNQQQSEEENGNTNL